MIRNVCEVILGFFWKRNSLRDYVPLTRGEHSLNRNGAVATLPVAGDRTPMWIRKIATRTDVTARLFCFPFAGGSAATFRLWPGALPSSLEIWAAQLPARASRFREPAVDSMPVLVEMLVEALLPYLDLPFALFGHSMGGVLAFEIAHALNAGRHPIPQHLIVSGRRPPHLPKNSPDIHPLSDDAFVAEINRRYGGIPAELLHDRKTLALLLPALRADVKALETFRPPARDPLSCPISAFGGADDRLTPRPHLEAWRSQTTGPFRLRVFPGDHFYTESHRSELLGDLSITLASLTAASGAQEAAE